MTCHSSDSTESIEHESRSRTETQVAESEQQSRISTARRDLKNTVQCGVPDHILPTVPIKLLLLNQLAAHLGLEWKSVLLDLRLSSADLYCCCANHLLTVHSQVLAGLVMWKQRHGRQATVQRLLQSLQTADIPPSVIQQVLEVMVVGTLETCFCGCHKPYHFWALENT